MHCFRVDYFEQNIFVEVLNEIYVVNQRRDLARRQQAAGGFGLDNDWGYIVGPVFQGALQFPRHGERWRRDGGHVR